MSKKIEMTRVQICKQRSGILSRGIPLLVGLWASVLGGVVLQGFSFGSALLGGVGVALSVLVLLAQHWWVAIKFWCNYSPVGRIEDATHAYVVPTVHKGFPGFARIQDRMFDFQERRFQWNAERLKFEKLHFPVDLSFGSYLNSRGLSDDDVLARQRLFGGNGLDLHVPKFLELYKEHALAPFFVFQMFCVLLWCLDEYWLVALFTGSLLWLMEALTVWKRLSTVVFLRSKIQAIGDVNVLRNGKWTLVNGAKLVPGDVLEIHVPTKGKETKQPLVPCDCVLISGSCVVNESSLTGENVALLKDCVARRDEEEKLSMQNDKVNVLFGGTKLMQCTPGASRTPNVGAVAVAVRTGFASSQGKVLRTISYASQAETANSLEAMLFILFLLQFAILAAGYVLHNGLLDPEKSRYKLLLHCVMILTSVVPAHLPIELALAVTSSLQALKLLRIFCTEPFRIPMAGKLDICCFDKTGTLTRDDLIFRGCVGNLEKAELLETSAKNLSDDLLCVIAGCQSLSRVGGQTVGDPLEVSAFDGMGWKLSGEREATHGTKKLSTEVALKFPFSAHLRRMTTIARVSGHGARAEYRVCVKGAPEAICSLLCERDQTDERYQRVFRRYAQEGYRVIALATKKVIEKEGQTLAETPREELECNLSFCGFVVFECLIREGTASVLQRVADAGMVNVMITGDSELTACAVARKTNMTAKPFLTLSHANKDLSWIGEGGKKETDFDAGKLRELRERFALCVTGAGLDHLTQKQHVGSSLFPNISVWARCSPVHKETVLTGLRARGCHTLMCGDGTNDVGALKQAHVGVAMVYADPLPEKQAEELIKKKEDAAAKKKEEAVKRKDKKAARGDEIVDAVAKDAPEKVTGLMVAFLFGGLKLVQGIFIIDKFLELQAKQDQHGAVDLGDASIAAPFTVRSHNIGPVLDVIRQGRCALVSTMQMYFILALNSLVMGYSLSVLHLQGVRFGQIQITVSELIVTVCFLFNTRAVPLDKLAPKKPKHKIFSLYFLACLFGQFAVHLGCMLVSMKLTHATYPDFVVPKSDDFAPNILNTVMFLMTATMSLTTFVVNYQGRPFMQSLYENRGLRICLTIGYILMGLSCFGMLDFLMEMVPLDRWLRFQVFVLLVADFVGCFLWERVSSTLFSKFNTFVV